MSGLNPHLSKDVHDVTVATTMSLDEAAQALVSAFRDVRVSQSQTNTDTH